MIEQKVKKNFRKKQKIFLRVGHVISFIIIN